MQKQKGSIFDMALILVVIVAVFIVVIVVDAFFVEMAAATNNTLNQTHIQAGQTALLGMDTLFAFLVIGSFLSVVLGAFLIDSHPAFFIVAIIFLILMIFITGILVNVTDGIANSAKLAASANKYPLMVTLMNHMGIVVLIFTAITSIVLFGKYKMR